MATSSRAPRSELQRLSALRTLDLLESAQEEVYDQVTRTAAEACHAPVCLLSLLEQGRQFCKSHHGLAWDATESELFFCDEAILQNDLCIVEDTTKDERFGENLLVMGEQTVRFYAGVPLRTEEGQPLGTLSLFDIQPRVLTHDQRAVLKRLGESLVRILTLRGEQKSILFASAIDTANDAVAISGATGPLPSILHVNQAYLKLFGCEYYEAVGKPFFYPGPAEAGERLRNALLEAKPDSFDYDLELDQRRIFQTVTFVPYLNEQGDMIYCLVVHRDRTAERRAEAQEQQLHAMRTTMRSINHVVLNFMNSAALYRRQMEGKMDAVSLIQFDMAMESTRAQLVNLAGMSMFKERKTPFGFTMLDPEA